MRRAYLSGMAGLTLTGEGDLFTFERYVGGLSSKRDEAWLRLQLEDARALLGILWTDREVDRGSGA